MNIQNWKIFDKAGSQLNWTPDPLISLTFESATGKGAEGFLVTDPSGQAINAEITNGGYGYDDVNQITLSYTYALESGTQVLTASNASIITKDVSVFTPEGKNTKSISGLTLDLSTNFIYPSATYAGAVFLDPISQGLIETEHLFILEETPTGYIRPYDASNNVLIIELIGDDNEIQLFTVDENTSVITWSDALVFDTSIRVSDTPIQVNIGFRSDVEGVYERLLRIYHLVDNVAYTIADIVINAESIGEDERFRTLITNFGLPDPKDMKDIFKQTDINEDLPDWKILNYKSKHIILEHDKIMPFIGTYKGLINAIKWLGYDDIYVREWFMSVKENKKLSFIVPYDAADRTQTILMFNADQRKTLKKLNQLSLNYCITKENGQLDDWGTPETENCYSYNLKEVFVKLLGLKNWLEKNIIGVNCRITDITGEGIYFERVQNLVYSTDNVGYDYRVSQSLTPYGMDHDSELVTGDASVRLTFRELSKLRTFDMNMSAADMIAYAWNPNDPCVNNAYSITDPSYLADPESFLLVGSSFQYPFINVSDIMYRLSVEKDLSGALNENVVTNPLFVYENEIRFYNTFDTSSLFHNSSTNLSLILETAYLRDPSIHEWSNSIAYSIYPDPCKYYDYIMESSTGTVTGFHDYVSLRPDTASKLQYAIDANYKVPLLSFHNFRYSDSNGVNHTFGDKEYILDIIDGKIYMDAGMVPNTSDNLVLYLNFQYDTSLSEQKITINAVYQSPRMRLFQFDPSAYYWADPSGKSGGTDPNVYLIDNSIYTMHVNHIGNYNIELFAWDDYNTMFYNPAKEKYPVWIKTPTVYNLIDQSCNVVCSSTYMSLDDVSTLISQNPYPIYDRLIPLQGLKMDIDASGNAYVSIPSITYFQDVPEPNSINKFINLTERVLTLSDTNITIDNNYQKFYNNDNVRLIKFDKGKYSLIAEESFTIAGTSPNFILNDVPINISIDASSDVYILNDTYRTVTNITNVGSIFTCDIAGYSFGKDQLVGIIVSHNTNGYSWGSTYKVIDVSGNTHTFDAVLPEFFVNNSSTYSIKAKHAFSSYSDFSITTNHASEVANNFKIYLKDSYCQEFYLDNTFVVVNILFDQDKVNDQWYDPSDNLVNNTFYYHPESITVDVSTLVILKGTYDASNYLLNQKNIWQVVNNDSSIVLFKVFNESVPYIFNEPGIFNVECTSYDSFGNAITKKYEGLIEVK